MTRQHSLCLLAREQAVGPNQRTLQPVQAEVVQGLWRHLVSHLSPPLPPGHRSPSHLARHSLRQAHGSLLCLLQFNHRPSPLEAFLPFLATDV